VQPVDMRATDVNGLRAVAGNFQALAGQTEIAGAAVFVEHGGRVFQLIGYTGAADWSRHGRTLSQAVQSYGPLRDRSALEVEPRRVRVVPVSGELTVEEFTRRNPSSVPAATVALINHLTPGDTLKAGQLAKQVVGGRGLQTARAE
jgi:predicted Zn-dependent protease